MAIIGLDKRGQSGALSAARNSDDREQQIDAALLEIANAVEQLSREVESILQELAEEVE
jgi:hypothetical protein